MTRSRTRRTAALACAALVAAVLPAQTPTLDDIALHVTNRAGFGWTPALRAQLTASSTAPAQWIDSQLAPNLGTDAPVVATLITQIGFPTSEAGFGHQYMLPGRLLTRAFWSTWQLNELMTWFWNTHFNRTYLALKFFGPFAGNQDGAATWHMAADDDFIRANALGTFESLLKEISTGVAMSIYLDNWLNTASNPNENFARELLELHTLGQVNEATGATNFTQQDVLLVTKVLSGWQLVNGPLGKEIVLPTDPNDPKHDSTAKTLFQGTPHTLVIPAGGSAKSDADALFAHLASTDATQEFVIRKLMRFFLSPTAPQDHAALIASAKTAWVTNNGNIAKVLEVLLKSTEFLTAVDRWKLVRNPLRYVVATQRAVGVQPLDFLTGAPSIFCLTNSIAGMQAMGQSPFFFPSPDGYPLDNVDQVGVSAYLDRVDFAGLFDDVPTSFTLNYTAEQVVIAALQPAGHEDDAVIVARYLLKMYFANKPLNTASGTSDLEMVIAALQPPLPPSNDALYAVAVRRACALINSFTHAAVH